jgi:hypothetical protein
MLNFGSWFRIRRGVVLPLSGLVMAFTVPIAPAQAQSTDSDYRARQRDYQICAAQLLEAGVVETVAADACAAALAPRDIGECVSSISSETPIVATDALANCRQVRRPVDLATCVIDISALTENALLSDTLDSCRRSLLPRRFSNCVVWLSLETAIDPGAALNACIAAGDRPRNVLPSFVPSSEGIPTTPSSGTTNIPDEPLRLTPLVPMQE